MKTRALCIILSVARCVHILVVLILEYLSDIVLLLDCFKVCIPFKISFLYLSHMLNSLA